MICRENFIDVYEPGSTYLTTKTYHQHTEIMFCIIYRLCPKEEFQQALMKTESTYSLYIHIEYIKERPSFNARRCQGIYLCTKLDRTH